MNAGESIGPHTAKVLECSVEEIILPTNAFDAPSRAPKL